MLAAATEAFLAEEVLFASDISILVTQVTRH